ncbi:RluA family pseudouridine synthase [bacterium]|nr:RluA family pseudouridine synthase [bacterium]
MKKDQIKIDDSNNNKRIDKFLSEYFPDYSRASIQKSIKNGMITVNEVKVKPHYDLKKNDIVNVFLSDNQVYFPKPEDIKLTIVFENPDLAIVEKPFGMVVHPTQEGKHLSGTLVNALLKHFGAKHLSSIGGMLRPGIIHRLDKDTSGLLIIAKNNEIHKYLVGLMKKRDITKKYLTLVRGHLKHETGRIEAPLTRAKRDRKKIGLAMPKEGREAITEYKTIGFYGPYTLVEATILTGRTHQIRVHFASIGHPVVGDELYGDKKVNKDLRKLGLKRQFLHATKLSFKMPNGEKINIKNKLPSDLKAVIKSLEKE